MEIDLKKMKRRSEYSAFSLVADFEGNMEDLLNTPIDSTMPVLALRGMMMFPGVVSSVTIGRKISERVIEQSLKNNGMIAVVSQKDDSVDEPTEEDFYEEGVAARVIRTMDLPNGTTTAIVQSFGAIKVNSFTRFRPTIRAEVEHVPEIVYDEKDDEFMILVKRCRERLKEFLQMRLGERDGSDMIFSINNIKHATFFINFVCMNMSFTQEERYELLHTHDVKQRAYQLLTLLNREIQLEVIKLNVSARTRNQLEENQKAFFIQQEIKNLREEIGETGDEDNARLTQRYEQLQTLGVLPEKVEALMGRELDKLSLLNAQMPDYHVQRNYLETLLFLPWEKTTNDKLDIPAAKRALDRDHYGMERVKERILEHLASLRYRDMSKSPILCLVGPPGVGKTSLCQSIAQSMGRKYVRISLGGVNDEAEIRGHRRTYVGSMPGRLIKGIMKADTMNPLFVLDEIDKLAGLSNNGDPQSAMLEVLDPEQNNAFHDNYLDIDFDLSKVFFIATANTLQSIPSPLLDRMEIIEVEGYLTEEKKEIARRHLVPKLQKEFNFGVGNTLKLTPTATEYIIEHYTRESGVRKLNKLIEKIFRKSAYEMSMNELGLFPYAGRSLKPADVEHLLGKPLFNRDKYQGNRYAGVVTGLAWTAVGGEILYIETSVSRSKGGKLTLTGNLGDVMKESAVLALEYIKAHADVLDIDYRVFDNWSIHIHVPEGATPKDGPSAGITIATSIASALTQRRVHDHLAMTGEITLRGKVLPVGGIKEKLLAARRAGITDILISQENRKDVDDIEPRYLEGMKFHFVDDVMDVLSFALLKERVDHAITLTVPDDNNAPLAAASAPGDVAARLMK